MSHAARLSAYYSSRANISLPELSHHMIDEITTIVLETERFFDEHDPACMPHVFQAKLDRWAYVTDRIATVEMDPVTALKSAMSGLLMTAVECHVLHHDWSHESWHAKWKRQASDLERNIEFHSNRGATDPEAAAHLAIDAQKTRARLARACALETFTSLANRYPAEALAVMDRPAMMTFEQAANNLEEVFDPLTFREKLITSLPPGTAPVIITSKASAPSPDDFY